MKRKRKRGRTFPKVNRSLVLRRRIQRLLKAKIAKMQNDAVNRLSGLKSADAIKKALESFHKRWEHEFNILARDLGKGFTKGVQKHVDAVFVSVNSDYKVNKKSKALDNVVTSIENEFTSTIKSIPSDLANDYSHIVNNAIGMYDQKSIIDQLKLRTNMTMRRMELVARDQVAKAMERYQMTRSKDLGFEYYVWETSLDERVAKGKGGHVQLHGRIYRYDTPTAIIDSNGTRGVPAQRINCRCTALALFIDPGDKVTKVKDASAGDYYVLDKNT